jgi:hypothetical protein
MEIFTLKNLTLKEIQALRQGLDDLRILGKEAMFIGLLQSKLNTQIEEIQAQINKPTKK